MPALRPRLGAPSCAVPLSYAIEPRPQSPRGSIRAAATAPGDSRPAAEDLGAWVGRRGGKDGWQGIDEAKEAADRVEDNEGLGLRHRETDQHGTFEPSGDDRNAGENPSQGRDAGAPGEASER